jgi:long-chain acyl-CoA synthetase
MFFTGHHRQPKGVVHTTHLLDRACRGPIDKRGQRRSAGLHADGLIKNIFSYAQWLACGYVVNFT